VSFFASLLAHVEHLFNLQVDVSLAFKQKETLMNILPKVRGFLALESLLVEAYQPVAVILVVM
jgi:hypothetical protein